MSSVDSVPLAPTRIRRKRVLNSTKQTKWSSEDDGKLTSIVSSQKEKINWNELCSVFAGKTAQQISERWSKVVNPGLIKGSWTRQEDQIITEFVRQYGTKNWTRLASLLPGRIGKQCRERWRNHLDPTNNRGAWTQEEDALLIRYHQQLGNQWSKIAPLIPGRSDNSIKNRWNSSLRKLGNPEVVSLKHSPISNGAQNQIQTPQSSVPSDTFPKPLVEETSVEPFLANWTPRLNPFDGASPFLSLKSPFGVMSPGTKGVGLMSPWNTHSLQSPGNSAASAENVSCMNIFNGFDN